MPDNAAEMVDSVNAQAAVDSATETNVEVNPSMEDSSPKTYTEQELDARIKARIDKQNARHALDMQQLKQQVEELTKRAAEVESERDALRDQRERDEWLSAVSAETGVPATLIKGASHEEMMKHANDIKAYFAAPVVRDSGDHKVIAVTRESIMAITNEKERLEAIRNNPELFIS